MSINNTIYNILQHRMDIFLLIFSMFFLSYFFPKDIITPHIIDNCMTDFFHHHTIMYVFTPLYSPICSTFSCCL